MFDIEKELKLFYCYSSKLKDYLIDCGFKYITCALNPNSKKMFWLFIRSNELSRKIDNFNK